MPLTPELAARKKRLAESLVYIEATKPGSVRLKANPYLARPAADALAKIGFKKGFFALPQQFVIDCFLTHVEACDHLLGDCAFIGPLDEEFRYAAWSGLGRFRGWLTSMPQFQPDDRIIFAINVAPILFFPIGDDEVFCNLLESPPEETEAESEMLKKALEMLRKLPPK